ncbi:hypothetical protein IQ07DRAFT_634012 [Pyrenochaeta sp. DS3sAY3a]|nr:hypothetical protein IQ07DRAFT_634012 [Pyrenochaeta sp. DS3sAY3a]
MSDPIGLYQWSESPTEVDNEETTPNHPCETPQQSGPPTSRPSTKLEEDEFDKFWNDYTNSPSPTPSAHSEEDDFDKCWNDSSQSSIETDPLEPVEASQRKLHHIYFSGDSLRLRITENRRLPKLLSRMTWEQSATQSCFTPRDCHIAQHRPIKDHQAFQALADFSLKEHMTLAAYERHHNQLMRQPPLSAFISLNDSLKPAMHRAKQRYYKRSPKGRRITIAQIKTDGLVPAEFIISHVNEDNIRKKLAIPIWVRDVCRPPNGTPITIAEFEASGADLYLSVLEQRAGGWKVSNAWAHGQDYEYMAAGFIDKKYITDVIPYDGEGFYPGQDAEEVQCEEVNSGFIFDRSIELGQWREKSVLKRRIQLADEEYQPSKRQCI